MDIDYSCSKCGKDIIIENPVYCCKDPKDCGCQGRPEGDHLCDSCKYPDNERMNEDEQKVWDLVHDWCAGQYHYIPDMNRRYLMDRILDLLADTNNHLMS